MRSFISRVKVYVSQRDIFSDEQTYICVYTHIDIYIHIIDFEIRPLIIIRIIWDSRQKVTVNYK